MFHCADMRERERERERERGRARGCVSEGRAAKGHLGRDRKERLCFKKAFLLDGRKTTMETSSEESLDKRGTNERSQRASALLSLLCLLGL